MMEIAKAGRTERDEVADEAFLDQDSTLVGWSNLSLNGGKQFLNLTLQLVGPWFGSPPLLDHVGDTILATFSGMGRWYDPPAGIQGQEDNLGITEQNLLRDAQKSPS
jgi:hypothetical protein